MSARSEYFVHVPYGLQIIESCLICNLRSGRLFCDLPKEALVSLEKIKQPTVYPASAVLFVEGQEPRGVFVLCNGRAKVMANSKDGKTIILKIAEAGDVLGLSATISEKPYGVSVETIEPCNVNFIRARDFLHFLHEHAEACFRVAKLLSNNYQIAYEEVRSLGLSNSISQRLAKLLLERAEHENPGAKSKLLTCHLPLTHEEIGQMIGTSRETVTRLFSEFRKKKLISGKGALIAIPDRHALAELVNS